YRMSGVLTLTYTNTNPVTSRPYSTKAFVILEPIPSPHLPDGVHVSGQIFKGVGVGATLSTDMLMQPIPSADYDQSGLIELPTEFGPTMDSFLAWMSPGDTKLCGTAPSLIFPALMRWDTDGAGLLSLTGDPDAQLHSGFSINYAGPQPEPPTNAL